MLELPGVLAYGSTPEEAIARVQALGLRVLADRDSRVIGENWYGSVED